MKICTGCRIKKPNSAFYFRKVRPARKCKECEDVNNKKWRAKNKPKEALYDWRSAVKRKYGLTEEMYATLLRQQDGCCAVCQRPATEFSKRLAVDHDHATGEIRGLLCIACNRYRVGRNRKGTGSIELLRNTVKYLDREYTGWFIPKKLKRRK